MAEDCIIAHNVIPFNTYWKPYRKSVYYWDTISILLGYYLDIIGILLVSRFVRYCIQELKLSIRNPSPHPLYVQPLLLSDHPDSTPQLLPLLSEIYNLRLPSTNFTSRAFSVLSRKISNKEPPLDPTIILPPQGSGTLTVRYEPLEETNNNALLILRNNLTVLDPVVLRGSCSRGFLTIDGVHPHGNQPLMFDFTQYLNGLECKREREEEACFITIFFLRWYAV